MPVELVQLPVDVPKELNDVRVAIAKLIANLANGQNVFGAVVSSLNELNEAVSNAKQIPVELREKMGESVACAGLIGRDVIKALHG